MSRFIFIAADFFKVTVDGQKVRATITDFAAAKAMAGKEVELVITSQIRDGVTRQAIPNEATITYTNTAKEDGTPGETSTTPPTPPNTPKEPTPDAPRKTVSLVDGLEQAEYLRLPEASQAFRFDIKSLFQKTKLKIIVWTCQVLLSQIHLIHYLQ